MKPEETPLSDRFIGTPDAFVCRLLGSISSHTPNLLTIELPDKSQVTEATWKALDDGLVRLGEGTHNRS